MSVHKWIRACLVRIFKLKCCWTETILWPLEIEWGRVAEQKRERRTEKRRLSRSLNNKVAIFAYPMFASAHFVSLVRADSSPRFLSLFHPLHHHHHHLLNILLLFLCVRLCVFFLWFLYLFHSFLFFIFIFFFILSLNSFSLSSFNQSKSCSFEY